MTGTWRSMEKFPPDIPTLKITWKPAKGNPCSGLDLHRAGFSFGGRGIPSLILNRDLWEGQAVADWLANAGGQAEGVVTR
jgi:hypothetical protein